MAFNVLNVAEN